MYPGNTLSETNSSHLQKWRAPKRKGSCLPTINFQGLLLLVSSHKSQVNPINHQGKPKRNPINPSFQGEFSKGKKMLVSERVVSPRFPPTVGGPRGPKMRFYKKVPPLGSFRG